MLERRVHYRRQNHYKTGSNKYKIVKTPGGKLTIHYLKRSAGQSMPGIPKLRSPALSRLTITKRTVARAYGGKLSHTEDINTINLKRAVYYFRDKIGINANFLFYIWIVRAFLIEEVKQMKRLMQQKDKSSKKSKKNKSKGKKK